MALYLSATGSFADISELDEARARWNDAAISQYEYGYNKYCECHPETPPETLVSIDSGTVIDVRHKHSDSARIVPAEEHNFYLYWTIEDLFGLLETAVERGAVTRADFDSELGYPTSLYIDYDTNLIGDEVDVRITRFLQSER